MAWFRYQLSIVSYEDKKMKKYVSLFLLLFLLGLPSIVYEDNDSRYEKLSKSLLCPVCQGETLFDSPSEYADDMRGVLKEQIANGLSDEQIMSYWTLRFGERINTNPQDTNPFLLLIPIFFGALFAYIFYKTVVIKAYKIVSTYMNA